MLRLVPTNTTTTITTSSSDQATTNTDDEPTLLTLVELPTMKEMMDLHPTFIAPVMNEEKLKFIHDLMCMVIRVIVKDGESIIKRFSKDSNNMVAIPESVRNEKNVLQISGDEWNQWRELTLDNFTFFRYSRGFEWKLDEATRLIVKMVNWRVEYKPEEIRMEEFLNTTCKSQMMIDEGICQNDMPIFYMWTQKDLLDNSDENKKLKFRHLVYLHERNFRRREFKGTAFQMNWIVDVSAVSLNLVKRLKDIFDDLGFYYPERLGRVLIMNAPWTIGIIWAFLSAFLSAELKAKYVMVKNQQDLVNYVDADHLAVEYGGNLKIDWEGYYKQLMEEDKKRLGTN